MSELSIAYIFQNQQLLVDQNLQLPKVEKLASDLLFNSGDQVIARDLKEDEVIPEGFQLVPIRQLITQWSIEEFEQASRALQLLEWRRNHRFCSHCGQKLMLMQPNTAWYAQTVAIISIHVSSLVSLPLLLKVMTNFYWPSQFAKKPCMA
jgi:NADH pyrophosphatase NudC (nudix superfamily)